MLEELINKIGYENFLENLIKFEKPHLTKAKIKKVIREFLDNDYDTSIFQIYDLLEG